MAADKDDERGARVPQGRLERMARFGGLASGIAGNMLTEGATRFARGEKFTMEDLLLTPKNAARVTDQLSRLRGAAMKVGQLLSMDAGELIPPELADILARLRNSASPMPPQQLKKVLTDNWGEDWRRRFRRFDPKPIAAASIGQVHRGITTDGRELAIKIQYPGVRESIDSDVDNVASLIRVSGLLPKSVDIKPFLAEAKAQLHEEADYEKEAGHLERFGALLEGEEDFLLPKVHRDFTTKNILAMDHLKGEPIEEMTGAPQETRDRILRLLIALLFRELFEFQLMQTDPNFANYQYDPESGKLILLDFGATRSFSTQLADGYRQLIRAGIEGDDRAAWDVATRIGLVEEDYLRQHEAVLTEMFHMAMEPLRHEGPFDFGATDMALRLRDKGLTLRESRTAHIPPTDALFLHRKFGGSYLLARRLKARVDARALFTEWQDGIRASA